MTIVVMTKQILCEKLFDKEKNRKLFGISIDNVLINTF